MTLSIVLLFVVAVLYFFKFTCLFILRGGGAERGREREFQANSTLLDTPMWGWISRKVRP